MSKSSESWGAFTPEVASAYLKTFGHPALGSKEILHDILRNSSRSHHPSILDLGCGNGQLYEYFKSCGLDCSYTGVDFSEPLLQAARKQNPEAEFIQGDINNLSSFLARKFDFVIYSHVIEMLESPEASLHEAKKVSDCILIRFFEPPEFEIDTVELREMDLGMGNVPYLRRKMSKSYYQLILAKLGCNRVDVYCDTSKDQIHVLYF